MNLRWGRLVVVVIVILAMIMSAWELGLKSMDEQDDDVENTVDDGTGNAAGEAIDPYLVYLPGTNESNVFFNLTFENITVYRRNLEQSESGYDYNVSQIRLHRAELRVRSEGSSSIDTYWLLVQRYDWEDAINQTDGSGGLTFVIGLRYNDSSEGAFRVLHYNQTELLQFLVEGDPGNAYGVYNIKLPYYFLAEHRDMAWVYLLVVDDEGRELACWGNPMDWADPI